MKKTKIICSIGPSSVNPDVFFEMVNVGCNVARINFSHATIEERENVLKTINTVRNKTNKAISKIMICTKSEETKIGTTNKETTNYNNNSYKEEINKENTGIFVVNKRMITDIHDYIDDNSSLELTDKNPNGKSSSIYMTPEKKKKYRYYS